MTRRTLFRSLAALPLVGRLVAKAAIPTAITSGMIGEADPVLDKPVFLDLDTVVHFKIGYSIPAAKVREAEVAIAWLEDAIGRKLFYEAGGRRLFGVHRGYEAPTEYMAYLVEMVPAENLLRGVPAHLREIAIAASSPEAEALRLKEVYAIRQR